MFPVEVSRWRASIAPWREIYGQTIRAIGGVQKNVFALDKKAVDDEIQRVRPLVDLGGYIPCPDHYIPPEAQWPLVKYYGEKMRGMLA